MGLLLAPTAAVAAVVGVVNIAGPNGTKAVVAKTGQLATAPADPSTFRTFAKYSLGGNVCTKVYTAPPGSSLILTQVTVDAFQVTSTLSGNQIAVSTAPTCLKLLVDWNPPSVGAQPFPLGPGNVIPSGHSLYAEAYGTTEAEVYGYGYLVPVKDAPTPTGSIAAPQDAAQMPQR
jgi:hypothetical protein